jgi:hypothetical protein
MRLSPHSAFRMVRCTQREQMRSCLRRGAPAHRTVICFPLTIRLHSFPSASPGGLHPVLAITARRLATTPPPPSLPYAGMFASHFWVIRYGSSPVPTPMPLTTLSCLLYAGRTWEHLPLALRPNRTAAFPFWAGCRSHFHPSIVTTLHTQVPRVSIGCRISLLIRLWLTEVSTLSAGFAPRRVPLIGARRLILMSLLRHDPSWASICAVKGRT